MRRIVLSLPSDLIDRLNAQALDAYRPLKWHLAYVLGKAAEVTGTPSDERRPKDGEEGEKHAA